MSSLLLMSSLVLGAEVKTTRSLPTTEVTIKMKGKALGTFPYGEEICLYVFTPPLQPSGFYSFPFLTYSSTYCITKLSMCTFIYELYREIEDKPEGELSLQIHTTTRLNQRKKMGRCNIVLAKLEDGKAFETWYSFSKKKRKGSVKSKGYLKVKVMWISAVVCCLLSSLQLDLIEIK